MQEISEQESFKQNFEKIFQLSSVDYTFEEKVNKFSSNILKHQELKINNKLKPDDLTLEKDDFDEMIAFRNSIQRLGIDQVLLDKFLSII